MKELEKSYAIRLEEVYHSLAHDAKAIFEWGEKRWNTELQAETIHDFAVKHLHLSTYKHCREFLRAQTKYAFATTHQGIYDLLREVRKLRHQEGSFERALEKIQKKYDIFGPYSANVMHVIRVLWGKGLHVLKALIDEPSSATPQLDEKTITHKEAIIDTLTASEKQLDLFPNEPISPKAKSKSKGRREALHPY